MGKVHLQLCEADRLHLQGLGQATKSQHEGASARYGLAGAGPGREPAGRGACRAAGANDNAVARWRDVYKAEGLAAVLRDRPRSGRPPRIDGTQRARVTALACSTPPTGHARWSLRLLAGKSVELGLVAAISHNHVRQVLKKTSSNRTSRRRGASAS